MKSSGMQVGRLRLLIIFENRGKKGRCEAKAIKEELKSVIASINDVRVDTNHIEVDLFSDDAGYADKIKAEIKERILETVSVNEGVNPDYRSYLAQRRFWEAHESLEERWKREKDQKVKDSIRVSIQFCAAMVHYQRCNVETAKEILKRAMAINSDIQLVQSIIGVNMNSMDRIDPDLEQAINQMVEAGH